MILEPGVRLSHAFLITSAAASAHVGSGVIRPGGKTSWHAGYRRSESPRSAAFPGRGDHRERPARQPPPSAFSRSAGRSLQTQGTPIQSDSRTRQAAALGNRRKNARAGRGRRGPRQIRVGGRRVIMKPGTPPAFGAPRFFQTRGSSKCGLVRPTKWSSKLRPSAQRSAQTSRRKDWFLRGSRMPTQRAAAGVARRSAQHRKARWARPPRRPVEIGPEMPGPPRAVAARHPASAKNRGVRPGWPSISPRCGRSPRGA